MIRGVQIVTALRVSAFGLLGGFVGALLLESGMTIADLLLAALSIAGGWLHFKIPPAGRLGLGPIAVFVALLLRPYSAPAIAAVGTFVSVLAFHQRSPLEALDAVLRDTLAALGAMTVVTVLPVATPLDTYLPYVFGVIVYVLIYVLFEGVRTHFSERVGPLQYVSEAGWKLAANLVFLASVSYVIRMYLFDQFGFVALALATLALAEVYHPWKLLSDQDEVLFANLAMLAQAIDIKDPYTAKHSRNVADVAVRIARALSLPEAEVRKVRIGALMHDIGKVGISGRIIRKASKLTGDETTQMREHPVVSASIMQPIELLADASEIVRHHHEHYDGSGYPDGQEGSDILLGSRIILVADAFDAMTTDRPYRRTRTMKEALAVLREHAGRQFDPVAVQALERVLAAR